MGRLLLSKGGDGLDKGLHVLPFCQRRVHDQDFISTFWLLLRLGRDIESNAVLLSPPLPFIPFILIIYAFEFSSHLVDPRPSSKTAA